MKNGGGFLIGFEGWVSFWSLGFDDATLPGVVDLVSISYEAPSCDLEGWRYLRISN